MHILMVLKVGWRYLLRHPWQTGLLILGITLGVAVMVSIDLANASASTAFDISTDAISGRATHQIIGSPTGFSDNVYLDLVRSGVVENLTPVIVTTVYSEQLDNRPFSLLGVDPFSEGPFRNYFGNQSDIPIDKLTSFLTQPGAVLISNSVAERYKLSPCLGTSPLIEKTQNSCIVDIEIDGQKKSVFLSGILEPSDNFSKQALENIILTDIATAQEIAGKLGLLDRIDLILSPDDIGQNTGYQAEQINQIELLLPEGVRIEEVASRSGTVADMTNAFRINLTALSLLALLVGLFLIYNTMTFSVIQRRKLFGTLRCLGVTRTEVFVMVVSEAMIIGIIGSVFGIGLGIAMGQVALSLVTQTINDFFFVVTVRGVQIPIESVFKGMVVGVLATFFTAAPPAWEAASVAPRKALYRSGIEDKAQKAVNRVAVSGIVLILVGVLVLLAIPTSNLELSFAGTFAILVGFAMLTPMITKLSALGSTPLLNKIWGILGRMAPRDITNSISRTSIAIAALMVAVSVTIGVSLMINSFRYTVETWLTQSLQGDIYISAPGITATLPGGVLNKDIIDLLNNTQGVKDFSSLRAVQVESPGGLVNLTAIDHPISDGRLFISATSDPGQIWQQMIDGAVIVSEPFANRNGISSAGDFIELYTEKGLERFLIAGIFSDYSSTSGTIRMEMSNYQQHWRDEKISAIALYLQEGEDVETIKRSLQQQIAPIQRVFVQANIDLRNEALSIFDRTFAITGAMRILATIVAFIGVLSTLLSLQLEKQRQFGILRAVGLTTRQLTGLILLETGFMGIVAGILAMPAGYVLSLILVYIINRRSFGWTLQMEVEPMPFILALIVAVIAALLAGIYPGIKMGQIEIAEALRSE